MIIAGAGTIMGTMNTWESLAEAHIKCLLMGVFTSFFVSMWSAQMKDYVGNKMFQVSFNIGKMVRLAMHSKFDVQFLSAKVSRLLMNAKKISIIINTHATFQLDCFRCLEVA